MAWQWRKIGTSLVIRIVTSHVLTYIVSHKLIGVLRFVFQEV